MSELSFIEKLLDGVEVEWKPLGEVSRFINGRAYKKLELLEQGKYPVLRVGNFFTNANWYYSDLDLEDDKYCANGDLLYAWSASFGPRIWEGGKVIYHYHIWKVVPNADLILKKFLFYLLEWDTKALQGEHATGSTMMHVTKGAIEGRLVPIPCPDNPKKSLEIQDEIVRILDAYTTYTAELTAELNLRKQQYNYYRDQLLSFEDGEVEWKTLEEVAHFANGKGHEKDISEDGRYIVVNSKFISTDGGVAKFSNSQICPLYKDDILLVMSDLPNGRALSKTFIVEEDDRYTLNQRIGGITVKNNKELLPKFLHYFLDRTPQLLKHDNGVDQTNLRKGQILEVKIPMTSPAKQAQIVEILDKFDTYTKSISEGLPREIALRKQQYEYYRDLLLSFPNSEAGVSKELKEQA